MTYKRQQTQKQYQQTVDQLRDCYNTHADKFSNTRKKHRPEFERIAKKIDNDKENQLTIIELGCGDGRLYPYLIEQGIAIKKYIGIDISDELIKKAKMISPDTKKVQREVDDMIHGLSKLKAESADTIICVASFQHLPNKRTREILLHHVYRVLKYGGQFITIDRSWSTWMLTKHRKPLLKALRTSIISGGKSERNNLMIPFTSKQTTYGKENQVTNSPTHQLTNHRLYHIFNRNELELLFKTQGFNIDEMIYSSQSGQFHDQRTQARNICTCVSKDIFVKSQMKYKDNKNLQSSS